ncbi:hypothetical protein ACOMICROBIO_GDFFDHBD_04353 [Vibrio sp. B1REV9]|nr:hypothetical protein ACOMICROBIO_GDFFDHBD_00229 [Vibrio sp. B1REV9]CAE6965092.1 hypothetical protein ACOMICROBIO_GDFFDHBD_04353 [Vibrio sp. B1REV9]
MTITNPFMYFELIKDYRSFTICGELSGFDTWERTFDFVEC